MQCLSHQSRHCFVRRGASLPLVAAAAAAQPLRQLTSQPLKHDAAMRLPQQQHCTAAAAPGRQLVKSRAGPVDVMPTWTLDQIAGLAFGVVMVVCYFGAQQVDVIIAKQQRRQLGLCEECGGLYSAGDCRQDKCPMKSKAGR